MKPIQSFLQEAPVIVDDITKIIQGEKKEIAKLKISAKEIASKVKAEKLPAVKKQLTNIVDDIYRQIKTKMDNIKELQNTE